MTHYILAVDPGKATGIALFSWDVGQQPTLLASWETQIDTYAQVIRWALATYPNLEVVCEKFTITAQTAKNSQAPFSLEHIGIYRQCLIDVGRDPYSIKMQTPTDAKNMFPNPKLKKLGFWHKGGEGHALDGIRHGLLYLVGIGWKPTGLLS